MEMLMIKKIKKKGIKKISPSDSDPAKYIRDSQLMPGSGIDKKKAKKIDFFGKDNTYPV